MDRADLVRECVTVGLVAFAGTPLVIRAYRPSAVLDHPGERSSHEVPTIRGGGLAMAVSLLVGVVFIHSDRLVDADALLLAAGLFALVGLCEDLLGLRPLVRLCMQIVAATIILPTVFAATVIPAPTRVVLTVLAFVLLVGFVNAFNFMDGINGISGVNAVVMGSAYALIGRQYGHQLIVAAGVVVAAAGAGFLPWNFPRARCFPGDAGAYALGAWLGMTSLLAIRTGIPVDVAVAPLAIYIADTGVTLARRVWRGDTWYLAHREHTYQRLTEAGGWSHTKATLFVGAMSGIVATIALGVDHTGTLGRIGLWVLAAGVIALYLLSAGLVRRWRARRHPSAEVAGAGGDGERKRLELVGNDVDHPVDPLELSPHEQSG